MYVNEYFMLHNKLLYPTKTPCHSEKVYCVKTCKVTGILEAH